MNLRRKLRAILLSGSTLLLPGMAVAQLSLDTPVVASSTARTDAEYYDALKARGKGDQATEEKLLLQVVKQQPENDAAWYDLSRLAFRQTRPEKAMTYIRKALAINSTNKWYKEHLANVYVLGSDFEAAAKEYAALGRTEKYSEDYFIKAAQLYQRSGKYKEAIAQLDALQKKTGTDDDILQLQQQVYLRMNDLESAAKIINQLIARHPKEPKYYTLLAELYMNNKETEKAKEAYEGIRKQFPDHPDAQFALTQYYQKNGDSVLYKEYVRKVVTNPGLDVETQSGLLKGYLRELDWTDSNSREEALFLSQKVAELHPDNVVPISIYGDVLRTMGKQEEANVQYRKVVTLNPSRWDAWELLFDNYAIPAYADSLIASTDRAARLFPNQALVYYYNGIGHYFKGEHSDAIRSINRAIDLQPEEDMKRLSQMHTMLGDIFNAMKKYEQSDKSYEEALRLNPDNATLLNNYAYYLSLRKERLDDAEKMSKRSLAIAPNQATFLDTYGWILYQQGSYEKALKYLQQAVDAGDSTSDGTVWEHLGDVNFKLGKHDRAMEAWKKAKEIGTEGPNIDKKIADQKLYE